MSLEKAKKYLEEKGKKIGIFALLFIAVLLIVSGIYLETYYHSVDVEQYITSTANVDVKNIKNGIFFDGPGKKEAMIFYPGAKVETDAYAPLMHELAENGVDCFLVDMPFHMAFFGMNRAESIMKNYNYDTWYLGGHSLGGAMIASFAADHADQVNGLLLLAAYTTKDLSQTDMKVTTVYGSEDGVLNLNKVKEGRALLPEESVEKCIKGGNHAQFGSYGTQKGDGTATISEKEQIQQTVETFLENK